MMIGWFAIKGAVYLTVCVLTPTQATLSNDQHTLVPFLEKKNFIENRFAGIMQ